MEILRSETSGDGKIAIVSLYIDELDFATIVMGLVNLNGCAFSNVFVPASLIELPEMEIIKLMLTPYLTISSPWSEQFQSYEFGSDSQSLAAAIEHAQMEIDTTMSVMNNANSSRAFPFYETTLKYLRKTLKYCIAKFKECNNG
jgi:hypothetical protein